MLAEYPDENTSMDVKLNNGLAGVTTRRNKSTGFSTSIPQ